MRIFVKSLGFENVLASFHASDVFNPLMTSKAYFLYHNPFCEGLALSK